MVRLIKFQFKMPFWLAIYATEPERVVDVRMSYSDLKIFCDLLDKEWEEMHK